MTHDHPYLDHCPEETLHTLFRYIEDRLRDTEDNMGHAERVGDPTLWDKYHEWEMLLHCMRGEVSWHIEKRGR